MVFKDFICSSAATLVAEVLTLPICSVKTNYQIQNTKTITQTVKNIHTTFGLKGFYNASSSAIMSQIMSTASKYTFYNMIKDFRKTEKNDLKNNLLNGGMSGILSIIVTHPFDVIKNHQQRNIVFLDELKKTGTPLFYRGITQSASKSMLISSILFPTYDFYGQYTSKPYLQALGTTLTVTVITQPLDLMKVRKIANKPIFLGFNPLNYYHGISLNLMRSVPHFMITMTLLEKLKIVVST
jgi:hypothetical protein